MKEIDFSLRRYMLKRRTERPKHIHKSWVGAGTGFKAVFTDLFVAFQVFIIALVYALLANRFVLFFIISVIFTALTNVYVLICEPDVQSKISWTLLFAVSFGGGYIAYFLSRKFICYGIKKMRYKNIALRVQPLVGDFSLDCAPPCTVSDAEYLYKSGGYIPYSGTEAIYFADARKALDNILACIENAEKFVFMEFFIAADGIYMDRLVNICKRKTAEGVEIRFLYDDVGSAGVFSNDAKKRLKDAGVRLKAFSKLFSPFYFGLNYRDHRKIVVVDGKTGFTGGFNFIDDCANQRKMEGVWKDSGIRLDGLAVDGLSLMFLRQWEFSTKEKPEYSAYLGKAEKRCNTSVFIPYGGGPEIKEPLCRGIYSKVIDGAKEKLYIMTPYLIPDSVLFGQLKRKAAEGVDVRIVLPGVPDYRYIYSVTQSNASKLIKNGVKIYYAGGEFVHGKVMLTENCAIVGSVNLDMRAFYQEFDNGVYTNDAKAMDEVLIDFEFVFVHNSPAEKEKINIFGEALTGILRLVSPLM